MRPPRYSIFTAAWLATMCSLLAVGYFTSHSLKQEARRQLQAELDAQALLFREQVVSALNGNDMPTQRHCVGFLEATGNQVRITSPGDEILCDSARETSAVDKITQTSLVSEEDDPQTLLSTLGIQREGVQVGTLHARMPAAKVERKLSAIERRVWLSTLALALATTAISLIVNYRVRQPLELMRRSAQRLAQENLTGERRLPSTGEMSRLASALDQMADQLEQRLGLFSRRGSEQEAVLASMVEGVLAVDPQEHVISINAAAADLLGAHPDDAKGKGLQEVIRNADLRRFVTRTLASDQPVEDDLVLRADEERVLQAHGTSLRDSRGRPIGAVIVLNDVTHVRRLENMRRDFVANVSHELKTPITSIKGFVETLLDGALHSPEDSERFLRIVARQADRLNAIIEDLLSLAKIEQADTADNVVMEPCRVRDVLQAAIGQCASKAAEQNVAVQLSCDPEILAEANPTLLEQAITNLLDNAIKYSEPREEVHVEALRMPGEVQILVRDQGCGIEVEHLDRLFERFYRVDKARSRKMGGTGLGLAIVKHIVNAHGGRVSVASTPGAGSTFTIHLPV